MIATIRNVHTPYAAKGKYAVHRQWNAFIGDFLHAWDDEYGASFTGVGGAMLFDNKDDAVRATIEAKRLVPAAFMGGAFVYDAVLLA